MGSRGTLLQGVINNSVSQVCKSGILFSFFFKMIKTTFLLLLVSVATAQTVIDIPINKPLYDLPGNSLLQPKKLREVIDIDLIPATIRIPGRSNGQPFLEFNAPVYKDKNSVDVFIFGPTLRLKRNITTKVTLSNKLFNPESDSEVSATSLNPTKSTN
jgi:hypothetical protein